MYMHVSVHVPQVSEPWNVFFSPHLTCGSAICNFGAFQKKWHSAIVGDVEAPVSFSDALNSVASLCEQIDWMWWPLLK